jgi:hypothetical protein
MSTLEAEVNTVTVKRAELSTLRMTAGNEKRYPLVILDGVVKEWIGFGWINLRDADETDFNNLPVVED